MAASIVQLESKEKTGIKPTEPVIGDIRKEWDWVQEGIKQIIAEDCYLTFRPEDAYSLCVNDQAVLWVSDGDFAITTTEIDEFTGDKVLLLWLAWTKHRGRKVGGIHTDFFMKVAKENGYKKLQVRSKVKPLAPYLFSQGFRLETVVYTRQVADEFKTQ